MPVSKRVRISLLAVLHEEADQDAAGAHVLSRVLSDPGEGGGLVRYYESVEVEEMDQ